MSMMPNTYQQNRQAAVVSSVTDLLKNNMKAIQSCLPKHMTPERMNCSGTARLASWITPIRLMHLKMCWKQSTNCGRMARMSSV